MRTRSVSAPLRALAAFVSMNLERHIKQHIDLAYESNVDLCCLMKRVVILGRGGAGKSTFARKLGERTGLPVIELDKYFWQPGLVPTARAQWMQIQQKLVDQERWIMDGDLGKYDEVSVRLQAAYTVLILDFPLLLCLMRAMRRSKERMDFWWWLVTWRLIERPKIKRIVAQYAERAKVHVFSNPDQLERYLSSIESGRSETGK